MTKIAEARARVETLQEESEANRTAMLNTSTELGKLEARIPHITHPLELAEAQVLASKLRSMFPSFAVTEQTKRAQLGMAQEQLDRLLLQQKHALRDLEDEDSILLKLVAAPRIGAIADELSQLAQGLPGNHRSMLQDLIVRLRTIPMAYHSAEQNKVRAEKFLASLGE